MRTVTAIKEEMEHWSKICLFEPQPLGKHKRRERDDDAGASRAGSGKVLKVLNAYPVARKVPGAFSGGEATQPAGKAKLREREEDDAGAFHGGSGKSLKTTNVSPASQAGSGGFRSTGGEEMKRLSSASRREFTNVRRDWPSGTAPNVDHRTRNVSALSLPREGSTSLVKKTGNSTYLVKTGRPSTSLVKIGTGTSLVKKTGTNTSPVKTVKASTSLEWLQARKTVMTILKLYRDYCKTLEKDKSELDLVRVDLISSNLVKRKFPHLSKKQPVLGTVPGIEVGQRFTFRAELHLARMHGPLQCGIDTMVDARGNKIAISVVDSGRYDNYMSSLETLVYCAQGSSVENQKQKKVNLAMLKSKELKNPVRVIRTRKVENSTVYFYDGLYTVEGMWEDRKFDGNKLRFKLVRIPGQPSSFPKKKPSSLKPLGK